MQDITVANTYLKLTEQGFDLRNLYRIFDFILKFLIIESSNIALSSM